MLQSSTGRGDLPPRMRMTFAQQLARSRPVVASAVQKAELVRLLGVRPALAARRSRRALVPLDPHVRSTVYAEMWQASAAAVGAAYHERGAGYGEIRRGDRATRVYQQVTQLDDAPTLRWALRHDEVYAQFRAAGLSTTQAVPFTPDDLRPALNLIARTGPCVVKPAQGTAGGDGVTVGVDAHHLPQAVIAARRFAGGLVAEQQVTGYVFRVLLLDGEVLDVIRDDVPHVVGDGRATIIELMAAENQRREAAAGRLGLSYWEFDLDTALTLRRGGRHAGDVLPPGVGVPVKSVSNDRRVEDSQTVRDELDPSVLEEVREAACIAGLRLAGVDIVAPSLDLPLSETGGVLLEVNGAPGIHRHYQVKHPELSTDVAAAILQRLLD